MSGQLEFMVGIKAGCVREEARLKAGMAHPDKINAEHAFNLKERKGKSVVLVYFGPLWDTAT